MFVPPGGGVQGATKGHLCLSLYVSMFVSLSPQGWGSGSREKVGVQGWELRSMGEVWVQGVGLLGWRVIRGR